MARRKTHEEFCKEVYQLFGNKYKVLGQYINSKTNVLIKNTICNHEYPITPNNLFSNHPECPKCSIANRTKTTEYFINEVYDLVDDEYSVLGEYINSYTGIKMIHNICGHEWSPTPTSFLNEKRCPKCFGNIKKKHEEFVKEVYLINKNIKILGKYSSQRNTIKCQCLIDGHIWHPYPSVLLSGGGCPKCAGNAKKTHEEFIEELNNINTNILVLGKYININTKIKCQCKIDNHIWYPFPFTILKNTGCPICNQSKGEKECNNILLSKNFVEISNEEYNNLSNVNKLNNKYYIPQKEFDSLIGLGGGLLSYDFFIPKLNLFIEYQGIQHEKYIPGFHESYDDFLKQKEHDRRKREYAKINNIRLLEIWYYDFDNIEDILERELNLI